MYQAAGVRGGYSASFAIRDKADLALRVSGYKFDAIDLLGTVQSFYGLQ
jgi:hypothetical protein